MKLYGNINDLISSDKSTHKRISLVDICSSVYSINEADAVKKTNQIIKGDGKDNTDSFKDN